MSAGAARATQLAHLREPPRLVKPTVRSAKLAIRVHALPTGTVAGRSWSPCSVGCRLAVQRVQEVRDLGVDGTGMGDVGGVRSPVYQGKRVRVGQAVAQSSPR